MSTPRLVPEQRWSLLATMPELRRINTMQERYLELARLSQEERRTRLRQMIIAEAELPDTRLFDMIKSRLRAWTRMDERAAHIVARDYYPTLLAVGARVQERFKGVEQLVFDSLPWEQKRLSLKFIPNDEGYVPDLVESIEPAHEEEVSGENIGEREEMEERVTNRWERFRAWVTSMTRAA